jgi:hypothetical protein
MINQAYQFFQLSDLHTSMCTETIYQTVKARSGFYRIQVRLQDIELRVPDSSNNQLHPRYNLLLKGASA